jgi:hypothetical protein
MEVTNEKESNMLNVTVDKENGIAMLEPHGALTQNDFEWAAQQIDPLIESAGELKGLIIHVETFPGWDSFAGLVAHLKFVREHHKETSRLAFVTDSHVGDLAEKIGNHFIAAEIRHFDFQALENAKTWILSD